MDFNQILQDILNWLSTSGVKLVLGLIAFVIVCKIINSLTKRIKRRMEKKNVEMLTSLKIFSEAEIRSRYEICLENYCKTLNIEALTMVDMVRKVAANVFIPFTVGGGIRTVDDFKRLLREGADKISVNSAAIDRPELIREAADKFGSQCVVVAIDAKRREDGGWNIYKHGGRLDTGIDAIEWAKKVEALGAGEILLTSMDCDGQKTGYDLELTRAVSCRVNIPVIASGGAGTMEHFSDAFELGEADAVLAASLFHFGEVTIPELKDYLQKKDITVRKS